MARHKNTDWNLREGTPNGRGGYTHATKTIIAALLMDIRDELKELNARLRCPNLLAIPRKLEHIRKNTARRRKGMRT